MKLRLENYRRFREPNAVAFPPGITIVSGPNGAGKSTLVEAVTYALFGSPPSIQDCRSDSTTGETCVECDLTVDGQALSIKRYPDRVEVLVNGVVQVEPGAGSNSAAEMIIGRLLNGLSRDQFESTYIALQGDTAGLVEDRRSHDRDKRKRIIETILQFDVVKQAVAEQLGCRRDALSHLDAQIKTICDDLSLNAESRSAVEDFRKARKPDSRAPHLQRFLSVVAQGAVERERVVAEGEEAERLAHEDVVQWKQQVEACTAAEEEAAKALDAQKKVKAAYDAAERVIADLSGRVSTRQADIERITKQIALAEQCADAASEHSRLEARISELSKRKDALPRVEDRFTALTGARQTLEGLDERLAAFEGLDDELTEAGDTERAAKAKYDALENDPTEESRAEWNERNAALQHDEKQAKQALTTLKDVPHEAKCPTCNQRLDEHTAAERVEHLETLLRDELPRRRSELTIEGDLIKEQQSEWRKQRKAAFDAWQKAQTSATEARSRVTERNGLIKQRATAAQKLELAEQKWAELDEAGPYNPEELTLLDNELDGLQSRAEQLEEQAALYNGLPALRTSQKELRDELGQFEGRLTDEKARQEQIGYRREVYDAAEKGLSEASDRLNRAKDELRDAEIALVTSKGYTKNVRDKRDRTKELQTALAEASRDFQRQDRLTQFMGDFQDRYFAANTQTVVERAKHLLMHAVTDQTILGIKFENDRLYYLDGSHVPKSVGRLSGGEKALVGLCLRIGLAEQAQTITSTGKIQVLILDEVLSSLDDERRDAVQVILDDVLARGIFKHIIVITHLETVKQDWRASCLEVLKVDGKTSKLLPPGESAGATGRDDGAHYMGSAEGARPTSGVAAATSA